MGPSGMIRSDGLSHDLIGKVAKRSPAWPVSACREAPGFIRNLKPSFRMRRETERASGDPIHSGPHDPAIHPLRDFVKNRNQRFYTTLI